jgi:hypothetical protein
VRSGRGPVGHTLLRLWHRRATGVPAGATTVVGFVVAFARDQQRPRSATPGSDYVRAYDLPKVLWWSRLIAGSTTLKASVPTGTGGSNSSAPATPEQH